MKREFETPSSGSKRTKINERDGQSFSYENETETTVSKAYNDGPSGHFDKSRRTYHVYPIHSFDQKFPYFRKPCEIGHFSHDFERKFKDDGSQLKCYCPPDDSERVSYDLREGLDIFIKRDDSIKEYLDDLLRWILLHKEVFSLHDHLKTPDAVNKIRNLSTDFVSWRGLYTKLLCTPYENREGWQIAVIKFNNTFYLCEYDTEEKLQQKVEETDRQKEMAYWGVKFEQYVTAEPGKKPDTDKPVNTHEAFCSIVRTRLSKHSLVFGGEVDCYETVEGKKKYIELKTSREMETHRHYTSFKRFKAIKWWAQSFLIGIEKIVCGFRDDDGVVHKLDDFLTNKIPQLCKDIPNCWEPNVCFNFLDGFLQHVKDTVVENNPRIAYVFRWRPREAVQCTQYPPESEYCFLPDWYIQAM